MKPHIIAAAIIAVVLTAASGFTQTAAPLLVDTVWLSDHLNDRDLVLLHVGSKQEYDTEHIRGSRLISDGDVTRTNNADMYDLPEPEQLRRKFASLGISDTSRIVVYFGRNGSVPSTTRIIFTLDYIGLGDRTSLLNGGMAAWKRAGKETTAAVPSIIAGTLSSRPAKDIVADADFVKSLPARAGYKLVDARAPVFYNGIEESHGVGGHIPGAINIPFSSITDSDLLIARERVSELFRAAGIQPGETIVAYCHIGQQATAVVFAARLAGYRVVLYDGSIHDWAMTKHLAVEK
jgi:thiosulfate/3-mercaptopyruvate sulfurtransferase